MDIGWCQLKGKYPGSIIIPPELFKLKLDRDVAMFRCPAMTEYFKNTFVIRSPVDIQLQFKNDIISYADSFDPVIASSVDKLLIPFPKNEWRKDTLPLFQLNLDIGFVSDTKETIMQVLLPEMHAKTLPFNVTPGQFNIYNFPFRSMNCCIEWTDTSSEINIKRGDPILHVKFLTKETVRVVECKKTNEVEHCIKSVEDILLWVPKRTKTIIDNFINRRPKRLIYEL